MQNVKRRHCNEENESLDKFVHPQTSDLHFKTLALKNYTVVY